MRQAKLYRFITTQIADLWLAKLCHKSSTRELRHLKTTKHSSGKPLAEAHSSVFEWLLTLQCPQIQRTVSLSIKWPSWDNSKHTVPGKSGLNNHSKQLANSFSRQFSPCSSLGTYCHRWTPLPYLFVVLQLINSGGYLAALNFLQVFQDRPPPKNSRNFPTVANFSEFFIAVLFSKDRYTSL